jgi:lipoyl(octanoyl) transferase
MATVNPTPTITPHQPFSWVEDFGLADYEVIWQRQKQRVEERVANQTGNGILIGEHHPIITLGRGSHIENLLTPMTPTVSIERGGDVTYHGPGQIVAYPILKLEEGQRDLHRHLRLLEQGVIDTLAHYGIEGVRNPGLTGVWIPANNNGKTSLKKVCSIGVAVKRWVTYHGLSLNVSSDLSAYSQINPCGLSAETMANLNEYSNSPLKITEIKNALTNNLAKLL